jgi:acyl-CoA reductase-like NAD-dependent aldehyde dehydrogenase
VVAGINAYNANTLMVAWKAAPALAAGNVIVLKAPEISPAATIRMAELAVQAGIPRGVVSVVSGRGHVTGAALAAHPGIGRLVFTGSAHTAAEITRQSAVNLKPLSFELGGKNAAIALVDVNLRRFIPSVLHSNFVKSGQSCAAGSRVFVHASRYEEVLSALTDGARKIRVGMPSDADAQMGSLISREHRDRVDSSVRAAVDAGAEVRVGGAAQNGHLSKGAFYQPTVVSSLTDDNILAREELFGPVVGVMAYDDIEEVISRANALDYGLAAHVWRDRASEIQYLVKNLQCGTVWVNMYRGVHWTAPYGGYKRSGYGRENGFEGMETYTQTKTVLWDLTSDEEGLPYMS